MRHCYPITEWKTTDEKEDVYHSLHHHGVAVESELLAYRIYFDKKQTIDPYCKRTPQLELAQSHWYPNDSLLAAGYGDDILRVSGTVGVGSVKYWNGKKMVHLENVAERSQRIVRQSRNSATIEVAVKDWKPSDLQTNGHRPSNPKTGLQGSDARCHFYLTTVGATKENHPVASSAEEWFAYLRRWAKSLK